MEQAHRRFLIVRTDRIGDVLLTLPMAGVLKRRFPASHVAMLIRPYTAALAAADPHVDEVVAIDDRTSPVRALAADLRSRNYDAVFHTQPRPRLALATALAGIPVRAGTGYRWYSFLFNRRVYEHRKTAERHELEYNLNLLRAVGIDGDWGDVRPRLAVSPEHDAAAREALSAAGVDPGSKFAILHPGSGGSARDWGVEKFSDLARKLASDGGLGVVITGGKGEEALVARVAAGCPVPVPTIAGKLGIMEFAALAKRASVFVANSTGPIHVAAAVGTPVVGLYPQLRPLSAKRWGPYTDRKIIFTPRNRPEVCDECSGRRGEPCACMETIDAGEVAAAALSLGASVRALG